MQYYCQPEIVAKVPRDVFIPQPNVDSAVLKLTVRKEKPVEVNDHDLFMACIKAGFGQRRKTMANSLTGINGVGKELAAEVLAACGIDSSRRAETLDLNEFAALSNELNNRMG